MSDVGRASAVVLEQVATLLLALTPDQIEKLANGDAHLEFVSGVDRLAAPTRKPPARNKAEKFSIADATRVLSETPSTDHRIDYLHQFGVKEQKALAEHLGISLKGIRLKGDIERRIAEGAASTPGGPVSETQDPSATEPDRPPRKLSGLERLMGGRWEEHSR